MKFVRLIKPDHARPALPNGEKNPKFIKEIEGPDVIEGAHYSDVEIATLNQAGYNAYYFPNHPATDVYAAGTKFLSGKNITEFNYIFADMDLKDGVYATKEAFLEKLSEFPLKPTTVVDSGNGIHAYWNISDLNRDLYVFLQLGLINYFKTDDSVWTVLQLMRIPNTLNTKRANDYVHASILTEHSSNETYASEQLPDSLFSLRQDLIKKGQSHLDKLDGKIKVSLPDFVNLDEIPDKFITFIDLGRNETARKLFNAPRETAGDRSKADMRLARLLHTEGFNKKEALAILANTEKAIEKGPYRNAYAQGTIDKIYGASMKYQSVGEVLRAGDNERNRGQLISGTASFDTNILGNPWRKREVFGIIAGSGVGKTALTLKIIKDTIENNPDNDDIHVFFSLEMPVADIVNRWVKLVGLTSPLAERLYVIGNEDEHGEPRALGLQEIHQISKELNKETGKALGIVAIDHIGIISKHIDVRKKYTFGIKSEVDSGWGEIRTLSLNTIATQMKPLAKMLDAFIIVLTQTTKGKGVGDIPIEKDGAYGISQYENIMDRIMTIWQPLMRVQDKTPLRILAWQYVKIREKSEHDQINTHDHKLMTYEMRTGDLYPTTVEEKIEFERLLPETLEIRKRLEKKDGLLAYSLDLSVLKRIAVKAVGKNLEVVK
jgi:hypothetical protein